MLATGSLAALLFAAVCSSGTAAVAFFVDNPSGFNSQITSSGLIFLGTENWESSTLAPNTSTGLNDPLAPGVANAPFPTGTNTAIGLMAQSNTLGGAAITLSPRGVNALSTASVGFFGTPSDQVSANVPGDSFDLIFNLGGGNPVAAVSLSPLFFDIVNATSSTSHPGTVFITVYDPTNAVLGTQTLTNVDYSQSDFLGIVATGGSDIRRVNLYAGPAASSFVAGADSINVYGVPEPSVAALMGLCGVALAARRRRTAANHSL